MSELFPASSPFTSPLLPCSLLPSHPCPLVLTAHKAEKHIKADWAILAFNQASFASNCFLRRGRNKIRRQKERGGGGGGGGGRWNGATLNSSLHDMERREPGVKVEMYNWAVCPYFVWGVGQSLWELRYVSFAPPPNQPEKLSPISGNRHKLKTSVCIYWRRSLCTHMHDEKHHDFQLWKLPPPPAFPTPKFKFLSRLLFKLSRTARCCIN